MTRSLKVFGLVVAGCGACLAQPVGTGNSSSGEPLLRVQGCTACHRVSGHGGSAAADLGKRTARNYTLCLVAAVIWNHAPAQWAAMKQQPAGMPWFSGNQPADLFAYFSANKYFERPGDARRGKQVFTGKRCAGCHGIANRVLAEANPVVAWSWLCDPIALAQQMWNGPRIMLSVDAQKGIQCPRLTAQEMTDLVVYLEDLPAVRGRQPRFQFASAETGRELSEAKGCSECHRGRRSLENRPGSLTMSDFAAAMWNHALSRWESRPSLSYQDMCRLVSYLW